MDLILGSADPGFFINPYKLIPAVVLLLVWARVMTWADKDTEVAHLPRVPVNLGLMGIGILGFALFFLIPNYLIGVLSLVFLVLVCAGGYIGLRASQVGTGDLSKQFAAWKAGLRKEKVVKEVMSELQLVDNKGRIIATPEDDDPDRPGYDAVQQLFTDPMKKNCERIQLTPRDEATYRLMYWVDGFPYEAGTPDRLIASEAIEFVKKQAGMNLEEKRKPQKGKFKGTTGGKKKELDVTTSGTSAGEAIDIQVDIKSRHAFKLPDLGMSEVQEQAIKDSIEVPGGIVLLSAPKGQGLTSLAYGVIRAHDAFLTHILTIERAPDQDLEGITQNKLAPGASPAEELKLVSWVCSQEPAVIMMTSLEEPASAKELIKFAAEGRKVYVGVRAGNAMEAVNTWRKWVGDDARAMKHLMMSVSSRVVRKLCVNCKVGVTPAPEQLKKLNLDPARVQQLFQERVEPMVDPKGNPMPCEICQELRFKGRTGIYEVMIVDDEVKEAVLRGASSSELRGIVRKQRMPGLQESALEVVQEGETSVKEVQRVFAEPASSGNKAGAKA